jgi:formylglycine-generating enzyme required for sulfatase activity
MNHSRILQAGVRLASAALLLVPGVLLRAAAESDRGPNGFVRIPPGTFVMGSPEDEPGRRVNETQHEVTLTRFYWLQRTEVTGAQWTALRAWALENGYPDLPLGRNGSAASDCGQHPVTAVSWYDVVKWLNAWSERDGRVPCYTVDGEIYRSGVFDAVECDFDAGGYRLPSEAEWEYACRAGSTAAFHSGPVMHPRRSPLDPNLDRIGWYAANSDGTTQQVGLKQPNAHGLHDMSGNVWEWCWDWHDDYGDGPRVDPVGAAAGPYRASRGGSWGNEASRCRSAHRPEHATDGRFTRVGFRPARTCAQPPGE